MHGGNRDPLRVTVCSVFRMDSPMNTMTRLAVVPELALLAPHDTPPRPAFAIRQGATPDGGMGGMCLLIYPA